MKDGKALGERIYLDGFALMTQLGVLPTPGSILGRLPFLLLRSASSSPPCFAAVESSENLKKCHLERPSTATPPGPADRFLDVLVG